MLPYASIPEAVAALGRNLTFAETLWFNYSAAKSDYFLYCHNILFLFLVFSLVPLPLVFLELKRFSFVASHKIQPKVRLSLAETFKCYKDVMRMFFLVVGPLQLISYPSIQVPLAKVLFKAYFVDNVNIGEAENVLKIAGGLGLKPDVNDQAVKDKTRAEVEAAIAKGVFGSPYLVIDGEPFWGVDRFDQIERWLKAPF